MPTLPATYPVNGTPLGSLTVSTLPPLWMIVILLIILVVMLILVMAARNPIIIIIIGSIAATLGIYTGVMATGYGGLMVIPYIFVVIFGGFVLFALWTLIIEKTQWG